jgi:hypothetical protein
MIVLTSLIPAVILSTLLIRAKKETKNVQPVKVQANDTRRPF